MAGIGYDRAVFPYMSHAPRPEPPSYLLEGRYLAEALLALGDVAEVFSGTDTWSGELVAIRRLRSDRREQEPAFRRACERLFGATSSRLVRAMHLGDDRDGRPFLVTELLVGRDVEKLGRVRWEVACEITRQAAAAVAEMHLNGLHHGGLRASSLFVAASNAGGSRVKLLDLGTGDRAATAERDVRSLAAILHRLLVGRPPLPARARTGKLRLGIAGAPAALDDALDRWLADDVPTVTAVEIADTLKRFVDASSELPRSGPEAPGPRVLPKTSLIVFEGEEEEP